MNEKDLLEGYRNSKPDWKKLGVSKEIIEAMGSEPFLVSDVIYAQLCRELKAFRIEVSRCTDQLRELTNQIQRRL